MNPIIEEKLDAMFLYNISLRQFYNKFRNKLFILFTLSKSHTTIDLGFIPKIHFSGNPSGLFKLNFFDH